MCRTIVGISANLCPVDEAGKNIHTSVSRKFVDGVRMVGGLPDFSDWLPCALPSWNPVQTLCFDSLERVSDQGLRYG